MTTRYYRRARANGWGRWRSLRWAYRFARGLDRGY